MDIGSNLPPQTKEAFDNFYQFEQQQMKKTNQAVQNAAQDQDNTDTSTDSTQQSS